MAKRNARFLAEANGRRGSRLWRWNYEVGFNRVFAGQLATHFNSSLINVFAIDAGVWASKVYIFEDAAGPLYLGEAA